MGGLGGLLRMLRVTVLVCQSVCCARLGWDGSVFVVEQPVHSLQMFMTGQHVYARACVTASLAILLLMHGM